MEISLDRRGMVLRILQDLRLMNTAYEPVELKAHETLCCSVVDAVTYLYQCPVNNKTGTSAIKIESPIPIWPGSIIWWEEPDAIMGAGLVIGTASDHDEELDWYLTLHNEKGYLVHARQIVEHHPHNIVHAMIDVLKAEASSEKQKGIIRQFLDQFTRQLDESGKCCE